MQMADSKSLFHVCAPFQSKNANFNVFLLCAMAKKGNRAQSPPVYAAACLKAHQGEFTLASRSRQMTRFQRS